MSTPDPDFEPQTREEIDADRARFATEFGDVKCPNCVKAAIIDHPENSCILYALMGCVADLDCMSEYQRLKTWVHCDVDSLWDDIRPIYSCLGDGHYSPAGGQP